MFTRICKIRSAVLRQIRINKERSVELTLLARNLRYTIDTESDCILYRLDVMQGLVALVPSAYELVREECLASIAFYDKLEFFLRSRKKSAQKRAEKLEKLLLEKPSFTKLEKIQALVTKLRF